MLMLLATLMMVETTLGASVRHVNRRQTFTGCCSWNAEGTCGDRCGDDGSSYCHLSESNCVGDCGGASFVIGGIPVDNCDGTGPAPAPPAPPAGPPTPAPPTGTPANSQSSAWPDAAFYNASGRGFLTTTAVGSSVSRLNDMLLQLATSVPADPNLLAVHSSGGAAGGVVSEGQGYGVLVAGGTLAALPSSSHPDFATVSDRFYALFRGWKRMATLSASGSNCQQDEGYKCRADDGAAVPCLPHWKFDDDLEQVIGAGAAPDGDEDAMAGMVLGVLAVESSPPSWFDEVSEWTYGTCHQFLLSNTQVSPSGAHRIVKLGSCWGGFGSQGQNPSYHAPAAYRLCRDFMRRFDTSHGADAAEGDRLASAWDSTIDTTYKVFRADQCRTSGLITNWAKIFEIDANTLSATTGFSGSGTPGPQYGSEASRGVWRVALDYALYPNEAAVDAATFLNPVARHVERKESGGAFGNLDVDGGCLVTSIHADWSWNMFMFGPTVSSLICPAEGLDASRQQAVLEVAGSRIASQRITDYYSGSWVAIATMTLNGDLMAAGARLLHGNEYAPPTAGSTQATTQPEVTTPPPSEQPEPSSTASPSAPPPATGGGGCCTWDRSVGCQGSPWCSVTASRCEQSCGGSWIGGETDTPPTTTAPPVTAAPTTAPPPLSDAPTTAPPSTAPPTTTPPSTAAPTTASPSTLPPSTGAPTNTPPSTAAPTQPTPATTPVPTSGCCTWYVPNGCSGGPWCSTSEARCGHCGGTWLTSP